MKKWKKNRLTVEETLDVRGFGYLAGHLIRLLILSMTLFLTSMTARADGFPQYYNQEIGPSGTFVRCITPKSTNGERFIYVRLSGYDFTETTKGSYGQNLNNVKVTVSNSKVVKYLGYELIDCDESWYKGEDGGDRHYVSQDLKLKFRMKNYGSAKIKAVVTLNNLREKGKTEKRSYTTTVKVKKFSDVIKQVKIGNADITAKLTGRKTTVTGKAASGKLKVKTGKYNGTVLAEIRYGNGYKKSKYVTPGKKISLRKGQKLVLYFYSRLSDSSYTGIIKEYKIK